MRISMCVVHSYFGDEEIEKRILYTVNLAVSRLMRISMCVVHS